MTSLLLVILVVVFVISIFLVDMRIEQSFLRDELAVHFRLLHSIDRNIAEILTKTEEEGDI